MTLYLLPQDTMPHSVAYKRSSQNIPVRGETPQSSQSQSGQRHVHYFVLDGSPRRNEIEGLDQWVGRFAVQHGQRLGQGMTEPLPRPSLLHLELPFHVRCLRTVRKSTSRKTNQVDPQETFPRFWEDSGQREPERKEKKKKKRSRQWSVWWNSFEL
ncbi:hypothetical protein MAP00_001814 [Monascus purpureus]|nr:hypothetical protein MAP00_001814 [Monascus purpureus]